MEKLTRYMIHMSCLCAIALIGSSCAKKIPFEVEHAEYQFPYKGKEYIQQQAYSIMVSNQSPELQEPSPGIEQVLALNGTELENSWSSGEFKQLFGPDTLTEKRSFFYKTKDGSIVRIDAHVLDQEKLFFNTSNFN